MYIVRSGRLRSPLSAGGQRARRAAARSHVCRGHPPACSSASRRRQKGHVKCLEAQQRARVVLDLAPPQHSATAQSQQHGAPRSAPASRTGAIAAPSSGRAAGACTLPLHARRCPRPLAALCPLQASPSLCPCRLPFRPPPPPSRLYGKPTRCSTAQQSVLVAHTSNTRWDEWASSAPPPPSGAAAPSPASAAKAARKSSNLRTMWNIPTLGPRPPPGFFFGGQSFSLLSTRLNARAFATPRRLQAERGRHAGCWTGAAAQRAMSKSQPVMATAPQVSAPRALRRLRAARCGPAQPRQRERGANGGLGGALLAAPRPRADAAQ